MIRLLGVHLESILDYLDEPYNCSVHNPQFGHLVTDSGRSLDAGSDGGGELFVGMSLRSRRQNVTEAADWINKKLAD